MTCELHGLRPSGHPTPATSAYPHPLTGGVRVLTMFPPPPRGENGEGLWSRRAPHPLLDAATGQLSHAQSARGDRRLPSLSRASFVEPSRHQKAASKSAGER